MEQEKELFIFIRRFKQICKTMYDTEVEVNVLNKLNRSAYSPEEILKFIEHIFTTDPYIDVSIRLEGLKSKSKKREVTMYKQCAAMILRNQNCALMYVGALLKQNHATVLYSVRSLKNLLETKEPLATRIFNRLNYELKKDFNFDINPPRDTKSEADS